MLFSVFGSRSAFLRPGMVTRPRLAGCLYCRWPPLAFDSIPSIRFNELDDFSDLHHSSLNPGFRDLIGEANRRGEGNCPTLLLGDDVLDLERDTLRGFG